MILLNFSHPITPEQLAKTQELTGQPVSQVIDVATQFDLGMGFTSQVEQLLAEVPLTPQQWQTLPILVNPPALNVITAVLLAELHGRMGYFPPVVRLSLVKDSLPPRYAVTEILNLQEVRQSARARRNP